MMGSFREYHNVNIPNSNSLFTHCLRSHHKKTAAYDCSQAAVIEAWTSLGLNQGPPDYESDKI